MFKKIVFAVVAIMLCLSLSLGVSAVNADSASVGSYSSSESQVQPRYSYTATVATTLKNSSGKAYCSAVLTGYNDITTKVQITMTLQKKTLLWWSEVEEWTTTVNDSFGALTKNYAVESGKYRVKAVYKVYSGSASESITDYSATVEF